MDDFAAEPVALPVEHPITLDEACTRLSAGGAGVEMLAAFHYSERSMHRLGGLESEFNSRFVAFATQPVT